MAAASGAVYCTLLMSDSYLPGAMVLAHSLRDNGTKARLAVLVTLDSLRESTIDELKTIYDDIIPINRITNNTPANLYLMNRPDLISTFTKIELWRQTQYTKIVYVDADIVALRAPDELLSLETDFAAVPDIGWPDCFNTGVMVLRPNLQDYYSLQAFAQRGISFDGADQGLLNMHFGNWQRLSFTYNCTPSGHYQYVPAFRHFQATISLVHYIGPRKPWNLPRDSSPAEGPYAQLLGRWWAVYDRHYRLGAIHSRTQSDHGVAYAERPENESIYSQALSTSDYQSSYTLQGSDDQGSIRKVARFESHPDQKQGDESSVVPQYVYDEPQVPVYHHQPRSITPPAAEPDGGTRASNHAPSFPPGSTSAQPQHSDKEPPVSTTEPGPLPAGDSIEKPPSPSPAGWDPSRAPPPLDSKPEGLSLPSRTYTMSQDIQLFQPPKVYPEAPKDMYYEVPVKKEEPAKPSRVFPWEGNAPPPSRVFLDESQETYSAFEIPRSVTSIHEDDQQGKGEGSESWSQPVTTTGLWETYTRTNAWDEVPEIERYMQSIQKPRKAGLQVMSQHSGGATDPSTSQSAQGRKLSIKVADFPTAAERPSLPVTPAPIRRQQDVPSTVDQEGETGHLPPAEGVPDQEEWNPLERLEELRRRQSTAFLEHPTSTRPGENS